MISRLTNEVKGSLNLNNQIHKALKLYHIRKATKLFRSIIMQIVALILFLSQDIKKLN